MELVVLAAGMGSRFTNAGIFQPKPLVPLDKKPLFWWATESALSTGEFTKVHFAILRDHISSHNIDKEILAIYPEASLHIIEKITSGAAETAAMVAINLKTSSPIAFVDCDVAFSFPNRHNFSQLLDQDFSAALCLFQSNNPDYSYAIFNDQNEITGTIEKTVVSNWAICGLYAFKTTTLYLQNYFEYKKKCTYSELFLSGVINCIVKKNKKILPIFLSEHLSLGTPSDLQNAVTLSNRFISSWNTKR
jgi:dTDP-glucose pyrophosphorylase